MKNRYMGRTFIMPTQAARERAVRIKLNPIKKNLEGRSVVLVDDSIVRGTTSRRIVQLVRDAGAREVHVRVGSPPIRAPCYLGVDMPTREELIASSRSEEEVCESVTATSLHYVSLEELVRAIGRERNDLCTGCLTGCYPVPIDGEIDHARQVDLVDETVQLRPRLVRRDLLRSASLSFRPVAATARDRPAASSGAMPRRPRAPRRPRTATAGSGAHRRRRTCRLSPGSTRSRRRS